MRSHPILRRGPFVVLCALAALATACGEDDPPAPKPAHGGAPTSAALPGTGPRVVIETPEENGHVRAQILTVRGRVAEVSDLRLNSEKVACKPDGSFETKLEVPGGCGEIIARDGANPLEPLLVRHVVVDLEAPMIELTELPGEPVENQRYHRKTNASKVVLRGRASDAGPGELATVTLDDAPCPLAADGTFSVEVDVPETGEKRCLLEAVDRAWNRARITVVLER